MVTRILSIDGGGIRGIVAGQVLARLEQFLCAESGNASLRLADCFDLIAGTSTGGILTCIYLTPDGAQGGPRAKFSAQDAVDLYLNHGDDIFSIPLFKRIGSLGGLGDERYPVSVLEKTLSLYLGDTRLSELLQDCAITAYDIAEREVVIFNSRDNRLGKRPDKDFYVRDVARATSAAPTYFEPANIRAFDRSVRPLVDGGVFANNPALCAYAELNGNGGGLHDVALLSVGTGGVEKAYSHSEAKDWGALAWVRPIIDITLTGVSDAVDYQLRKLYASAGAAAQYLRIEPKLGARTSPEMDDASVANMRLLRADGERAYQENQGRLEQFARAYLLPKAKPNVAAA
ncbi:MAG TPA: patatin-like phospholipase family protein [Polyangiaceae bacterium]|nr:patatin-like phospholipase family protein [Polyangiaceae bacterium]